MAYHGARYYGARFYGPRYWGGAVIAAVATVVTYVKTTVYRLRTVYSEVERQ